MKTGPVALNTVENESWREKKENGFVALATAENESGSAKHQNETRRPRYRRKRVWARKILKRDLTPSLPPKMSPSAKHENGSRRPRYRRKRARSRKT
jgi:hypothetical protein